jgi:hypothetical protein
MATTRRIAAVSIAGALAGAAFLASVVLTASPAGALAHRRVPGVGDARERGNAHAHVQPEGRRHGERAARGRRAFGQPLTVFRRADAGARRFGENLSA